MSNEGRICPKCGYGRQPKDLAPDYECPRCRILYDKYVAPKPKPPVPPAGENPALTTGAGEAPLKNPGGVGLFKVDAEELQPASLLRRSLAAIYTGSLVFLCTVPIKLFMYATIRILYPPESIRSWADIRIIRNWEDAYSLILPLLVLCAYSYRSLSKDSTWGQAKFGVTVRSAYNSKEAPTTQARLLRIGGNLIAFGTFPIALAGLLYGLFTKNNLPGIADRISSTRQYETGKPALRFGPAVSLAFLPLCIGLLLLLTVINPLCIWIMSGYSGEAKQRAKPTVSSEFGSKVSPLSPERAEQIMQRREAAGRQNALSMLAAMQVRHRKERGGYTEDLEALVVRYGAGGRNNNANVLSALIQDGTIRARKTDRGVEIWMEITPGNWIRQELHE